MSVERERFFDGYDYNSSADANDAILTDVRSSLLLWIAAWLEAESSSRNEDIDRADKCFSKLFLETFRAKKLSYDMYWDFGKLAANRGTYLFSKEEVDKWLTEFCDNWGFDIEELKDASNEFRDFFNDGLGESSTVILSQI